MSKTKPVEFLHCKPTEMTPLQQTSYLLTKKVKRVDTSLSLRSNKDNPITMRINSGNLISDTTLIDFTKAPVEDDLYDVELNLNNVYLRHFKTVNITITDNVRDFFHAHGKP